MTRPSLAARVAALEEKVGNKSIETQLRDQAELIDRRFDEGFRAQAELIARLFLARDQKWDVRFGRMEQDVSGLRADVSGLKTDVSGLKTDVGTLKEDVGSLKKDMTIVREGVGILLKRRD